MICADRTVIRGRGRTAPCTKYGRALFLRVLPPYVRALISNFTLRLDSYEGTSCLYHSAPYGYGRVLQCDLRRTMPRARPSNAGNLVK